ncbi:MAG: hypothetical protein IJG30_06360, partial [Synergistaceae bacterium]|nr:hypothetical protein [Synergistaceae bacterium]
MRVLKIIGLIFMVIASAVGGAALRLMEVLNDPNPLPTPKVSQSKTELPPQTSQTESASVTAELAVGEAQKPESTARSTVNVLIVGLDNVEGGSRTDAIALAIFDAQNKALRIASIPRDSRVYIPGRSWDKINHA